MIQSHAILIGLIVAALLVVVSSLAWDFRKKRKKGEAQFDIPKRKYRPGDRVEGAIVIHARRAVTVEKVNLKILCYTIKTSKGPKGSEIHKEIVLISKELTVAKDVKIPNSNPYRLPIAFVLPYKIDPIPGAAPDEPESLHVNMMRPDLARDSITYNWDIGTVVKVADLDLVAVTSLQVDMKGYEAEFSKAVSDRR